MNKTRKRVFPDISPRAFEHPTDKAAMAVLRKMTGFDTMLKVVMGAVGERRMRLLLLANGVRVNDRQMPELHQLFGEACESLDITTRPELYVMQSPQVNAMAVGVDRPFVVINSALLDLMDHDEIRCVMAHELAHILSGHYLYKTMVVVIVQMLRFAIPTPITLFAFPVALALKEWERKSELTADRATLLVSGDLNQTFQVIFKLSSGRKPEKFNLDEFEAQAKEYREGGTVADNVFKVLNLLWMSHPFPVERIVELRHFYESDTYKTIVAGNYPKRSEDAGAPIGKEWAEAGQSYRNSIRETGNSLTELAKEVGSAGSEFIERVFKKARK